MLTPFHIAIPVRDIEESRRFYGQILGFTEGRSDARWIDFNVFGHQVVVHLDDRMASEHSQQPVQNWVDGHQVPVPHFGAVLTMDVWKEFAERIRAAGISFLIEPHIRFAGQPGEQATMFFLDPSRNALEFKAFENIERDLFSTTQPTGPATN